MTVLRILEYPHASLSVPSIPVSDADFGTEALLVEMTDMGETLLARGGAGLASNQVGLTRSMFAVRSAPSGPDAVKMAVNPEVIACGPMALGEEGCISFRLVKWAVRAPVWIDARFRDEDGKIQEERIEGFGARVFWHESRHLIGKTLLDSMTSMQRGMFLAAVAKARRA